LCRGPDGFHNHFGVPEILDESTSMQSSKSVKSPPSRNTCLLTCKKFSLKDRPLLFLNLIKICQMTTGSIEEKAKYLLENIPDRNPFFAFADMSETSDQDRVDIYLAQISDKWCQSPSTRQCVICDFYFTYWS